MPEPLGSLGSGTASFRKFDPSMFPVRSSVLVPFESTSSYEISVAVKPLPPDAPPSSFLNSQSNVLSVLSSEDPSWNDRSVPLSIPLLRRLICKILSKRLRASYSRAQATSFRSFSLVPT